MSIGIGDALREERERQGRSIDEASRETRIRVEYLDAIEDEDFASIGGDVYTKGFIATYARWLGLDPEPLLERYRREAQPDDYDPHSLIERPVAQPSRPTRSSLPVWIAAAALLLLGGFWLIDQIGGRGLEPAPAPGVAVSDSAPPDPVDADETTNPSPTASARAPSPTPTSVNLVLLVEERSWMRIRAQDRTIFEGTLEEGASREFSAEDAVRIRFGNGDGVRLVLNGEQLGVVADTDIWEGVCTLDGCQESESAA